MPSLKEHVKRSKERTGLGYKELNEWLDGDEVRLLSRLERHFNVKKYSRYVQITWGKKGIEEYRAHLSDDVKAFITSFGTMTMREMIKQIAQMLRRRTI